MAWRRLFRCSRSWALSLSSALASVDALGQTGADTQAADRAFNEALQLIESGRYAEACPKLELSQRLAPASGTVLNLADCYEHVGRVGSAWKAFEDAAMRAKASGKRERERVARERAAVLLPRLSRIVLFAPDYVPADLLVALDGVPLPGLAWGAPLVVDAGTHTLAARATRRQTFSTNLGPIGEGQTVTFQIPNLTPAAGGASVGAAPSKPSRVDGQRLGALVSGGVGVVGMVAGTAFGLHSKARHEASDEHCVDGCDVDGVSAMQEARRAGNWSTAGFILGGVGLATASVLWFVRPFSSAPPAQTQVGLGPNAVVVRGHF